VGSGNNQFGEKNPFWKGGKTLFRKIAFTNYPHICNRCDATNDLLVHHKDKNRLNNNVDNLEILCKKCHQNHHCIRDSITGKYIKG
jgi:5-methylcytosine-specific restriction endonuclease McrA